MREESLFTLTDWRIIELDGGDHHLVGVAACAADGASGGRVTSAVCSFDVATMSAATRSGATYRLVGVSGRNPEAERILSRWLRFNDARIVNDDCHLIALAGHRDRSTIQKGHTRIGRETTAAVADATAPSAVASAGADALEQPSEAPGRFFPSALRVFDPVQFRAALDEDDEDDDYLGPEEDRPAPPARSRSTEAEVWARLMRRILADPAGGWRRVLVGDEAMAERVAAITATAPHFAAVTGIVERAVRASALTGDRIRFPPVVMLSPPGVGKSHYARSVAEALGTKSVPISLNVTSDRGALTGLSQLWRGARMGKLARAILLECETAAPLFLLDELDKTSTIAHENVADVLLSVLEPENAKAFVDEYLDLPIRLDQALWLASANDTRTIPSPLLSRMLVVEVPAPTREQARVVVRAIAVAVLALPLAADAVDLLVDLSARGVRQALELAQPFAVCARRDAVSAADVRGAIALLEGTSTRRPFGFTAGTP